jgi:hypothetical protein
MFTGLFAFRWAAAEGGYEFVDACTSSSRDHPVRVLVERDEPAATTYRRYDPLSEAPALFHELSATPPTAEGIIAFANKWGPLGGNEVVVGRVPLAGRRCEEFTAWIRTISMLREAVWIWDHLSHSDVAVRRKLKHRVRWEQDPQGRVQVVYDSQPILSRTQTRTYDGYERVSEILAPDPFVDRELSQPARAVLCGLVNANLAGKVSPQLLAESAPIRGLGPAAVPVKAVPVLADLRLVPTTLAACCWLQLAQIVSGATEQRQCVACGGWYESKSRRSDKVYCSEACRKRVHQEQQQEKRARACRLHAAGKKVAQIAKELGADVDQVRKWIANLKG